MDKLCDFRHSFPITGNCNTDDITLEVWERKWWQNGLEVYISHGLQVRHWVHWKPCKIQACLLVHHASLLLQVLQSV